MLFIRHKKVTSVFKGYKQLPEDLFLLLELDLCIPNGLQQNLLI